MAQYVTIDIAAQIAHVQFAAMQQCQKKGNVAFFTSDKKKVNTAHPDFLVYCEKNRKIKAKLVPGVMPMAEAKRKKAVEDYRLTELKRLKMEGVLIESEFIKKLTLDYLAALNRNILNVGERTADRIIQLCAGLHDDARQPIIELLAAQLSQEIKNTTVQVQRNLTTYIDTSEIKAIEKATENT